MESTPGVFSPLLQSFHCGPRVLLEFLAADVAPERALWVVLAARSAAFALSFIRFIRAFATSRLGEWASVCLWKSVAPRQLRGPGGLDSA